MGDSLRIALAQLDLLVGDVQGNAARVMDCAAALLGQSADLVIFPELTLSGYPPEDLLFHRGFRRQVESGLEQVCRSVRTGAVVLGYPEYAVRHKEPESDFSTWAVGCGAFGAKVTDPTTLHDTVAAALAHPGPALVDVDVNPNEPPMPGKVEYQQAKAFVQSFVRGQPHRGATMATIARDQLNRLFSRSGA